MRDFYQEVTDRIVHELEIGTVPWVKPWSGTGFSLPCNAVTNRPYSGINLLLFFLASDRGWKSARFLTYKQTKQVGGSVKKGEHGTTVVFVKRIDVKDRSPDAADDDTVSVPLLRQYTVFNVEQCEGLPEKVIHGPAKPHTHNPDQRDPIADEFIATTGADVREGFPMACYVPALDRVQLPDFRNFVNSDRFYSTAFHELCHWTGDSKRCNRDLKNRFGTAAYAAEELVAQLGAAFLCAEFGFDGDCQDASYIASWVKLFKDDKRAIFTAASKAQQAADFLRSAVLAETKQSAAA